jgi:hypothetical protein
MQACIHSFGGLKKCWRTSFRALLALAPLTLAAQELTLHVDVKLVNVFVNVIDQNGALASGLTREDFALFEDGRPQQISVFERQSELPLNLTLAIDTSGSVRKDMAEEADAATAVCPRPAAPSRPDEPLAVCHRGARADALHQQGEPDRARPRPFARRLGHLALRRHLSGFAKARSQGGPQGAGHRLGRRRHGQQRHLRRGCRGGAAQRSDDLQPSSTCPSRPAPAATWAENTR